MPTNMDDLLSNAFGEATTKDANLEVATISTNNEISEKKQPQRVFDTLSEKSREQAKQLSLQIKESDANGIIEFGSHAQKELGNFSQTLLSTIKVEDAGEVGSILNELMYTLNDTNPNALVENPNFLQRIFGKAKRNIHEVTSKYHNVIDKIDGISLQLDSEKGKLITDNVMLETLYEQNKVYFEALNIFIAAAELKAEELSTVTIPEAVQLARKSGNQMDVQKVNDLNQFVDRLEKRSYDLKLARQISIQQAPQIRLIQNTNQALAEKIQSSINTAIPLWKNQVVISISLTRQKYAVEAQKQVSQTTNDLLMKNSEMLKMSTIEVARENERGLIDIETLKKTQTDLVETLQETLSIQQEGRLKRKEAEKEISAMENQLKNSLLEAVSNQ